VRNADLPAFSGCMQSSVVFAFVIGGAFFMGVWTVVLVIAAAARPKQGIDPGS